MCMRVIGLDAHRSMSVVAVLEKGHLTSGGRIDLTRDAVIAFGRKLRPDGEVPEAPIPNQSNLL